MRSFSLFLIVPVLLVLAVAAFFFIIFSDDADRKTETVRQAPAPRVIVSGLAIPEKRGQPPFLTSKLGLFAPLKTFQSTLGGLEKRGQPPFLTSKLGLFAPLKTFQSTLGGLEWINGDSHDYFENS